MAYNFCHFNISARSSAFKCVYLFSICNVLWPVIAATCIGFSPFSKKRLVASCRRSWKVRSTRKAGSGFSLLFFAFFFVGFPGPSKSPEKGLCYRIRLHPPYGSIEPTGESGEDFDGLRR